MDNADRIWEQPLTRRQLISAIGAGGASMALVGCGDDDDSAGPSSTQTSKEPRRGGEITLSISGVPDVSDPHKGAGVSDTWNLVGNTPLRANWLKGTVEAGLVEKWESPDPTTLILTLKKGVHFQKESPAAGRELEASDVVASLERNRTPGDATFTAARQFIRVDTYEAVDKYTVRVKFKQTDADFLSWLGGLSATTVVPKETIQKYGANMAVIEAWYGTGPFIPDPSKYRPGISMGFKRNPNFDVVPGGLPYLDAVNLVFILDISARAAGLRSGQSDVSLIPTLDAKDFRSRGFQLGGTEDLMVTAQHLAMNVEIPPTNDIRVRQAIHRAIDREELMGVVADGFGCNVMILGCKSSWFLSEKEWEGKPGFRKDKKQDIAEAKQLLSAAGVDPSKTTFKLGIGIQSAFKVHNEQGIAIKGMLERNLGMKFDLTVGDPSYAFQSAKYARDNSMHLTNLSMGGVAGLILDAPLWQSLTSFAAGNAGLWNDKKTDDMYEQQATSLDNTKRKQILQDIQRYLMQDDVLPVAPTVRNFDWYGVNSKIRNWQAPAYYLSQFSWQYDQVWLDQ